jgi:hypothetical protein
LGVRHFGRQDGCKNAGKNATHQNADEVGEAPGGSGDRGRRGLQGW